MTSRQNIIDKSLMRISRIFHIPIAEIHRELRFGVDLKPGFVSDFRDNELDIINYDLHDAATKGIRADLIAGRIVIKTVGDYCEFMLRCSEFNQKRVESILDET